MALCAYCCASLRITDAGFRVARITYTNAVLFPPMALARALQRRQIGRRADIGPAPVVAQHADATTRHGVVQQGAERRTAAGAEASSRMAW